MRNKRKLFLKKKKLEDNIFKQYKTNLNMLPIWLAFACCHDNRGFAFVSLLGSAKLLGNCCQLWSRGIYFWQRFYIRSIRYFGHSTSKEKKCYWTHFSLLLRRGTKTFLNWVLSWKVLKAGRPHLYDCVSFSLASSRFQYLHLQSSPISCLQQSRLTLSYV
jgi:hypothetical protein